MSTTLIKGSWIVSMDERIGDLKDADMLVRDGRIAEIARNIAAPDGAEIIDARGMIAMPGFVNAHIHTWQTGLRGIAADWTIQEYMRAIHAGLATRFRAEDVHIGNLVGALNQINSGTTTLVDWCHNNPTPAHTDAAIDGLEETGVRAVFLHGSPKPNPKPGQKHFSEIPMPRGEVERLRKGRLSRDDGLVTLGLAILGPQMSVHDVCEADFALAKELGLIASMHVSGALMTPDGFERLGAAGLLGPYLNIVHGNVFDDERLKFLIDRGVTFTVTAEVEMQMGFGDPLTGRLRALGAPFSVGSDIETSMTGDMFSVARFTLQQQRHADSLASIRETGRGPTTITVSAREALGWATIEGARMVGLDDRIGSLTPGKRADIVLLDAGKVNMFPVCDPVASILLHAGTGNVNTVLIDGQIRKRAGRLVYPGLERRLEALARSSERILADFGWRPARQAAP